MAKNKIRVFPHHKALVVDEPRLLLLFGQSEKNGPKQRSTKRRIRQVLFFKKSAEIDHYLKNKMLLTLPMSGLKKFETPLKDRDFVHVQRAIKRIGAIEAELPTDEDARASNFREQIFQDYATTVFRDKPIPDPPERGPYGHAYIQLKEGAVPQRQKPFFMHGERQEAYKKVVEDWLERGYIERLTKGRGEWLSQGFVVAKPDAEFPWRGVVDLRGPNSQTVSCNYPPPRIEDVLVKLGACHIFFQFLTSNKPSINSLCTRTAGT